MLIKALIADDDMDVHQLMYDLIEMNFREVKVERALTLRSFWDKIGAEGESWHLIFLSADYIKEEPEGFLGRVAAANPDLPGRIVVMGSQQDFDNCGDDIQRLPFLSKPFSLDRFEEIVKSIAG